MPQTRECDYCGADIEAGTGTMLVQKNGQTIHYCSAKCEKNADLGREARDLNWTASGRESDRQETVSDQRDAEEEAAEAEADAADEEDTDAAPDLEEAEDEAESGDEDAEETDADSDEDTEAEEAEA
jgi:large subunit ribosomal protein L24e